MVSYITHIYLLKISRLFEWHVLKITQKIKEIITKQPKQFIFDGEYLK